MCFYSMCSMARCHSHRVQIVVLINFFSAFEKTEQVLCSHFFLNADCVTVGSCICGSLLKALLNVFFWLSHFCCHNFMF